VGSFAECLLPSVTLGKDFAEWNLSFAECNGHSAKFGSPVVMGTFYPFNTQIVAAKKHPKWLLALQNNRN